MDTSEIYIKMCDCEEVQGQRNPGRPSYDDFVYSAHYTDNWIKEVGWEEGSLWLPRQDQIQEMRKDRDSVWFMHHRGEYIVEDKLEGDGPKRVPGVFLSMEQAWLAWYMFRKYDKTWDGKKWMK